MQDDFGGGASPVVNVYTYDLVAQVLRDNVTFSSGAIRELMELVMGPFVLVGMDEPEHKRHRALVSAAFRHKSLVRWETEVIDPIMHDLIDGFADRDSVELVREFTYRFPVQIIAEILGVPHEDHEKFHDMAVWVVNVAANPEKGIAASHALREYLADIVEAKRSHPGDDVISLLVQEELDGERLDDEEIFSFLRLLLPAGAETTYRATGSFLYGLLTNPDQLDALRRSLAHAAGRRGVDPLGVAAVDHLACGHGRHRRRRRRDPGRHAGRAEHRLGQPRRDPLGSRRRLRPLPSGRSPHQLRCRPAHVPRHAPRPHGDGRAPSTRCSTASRTCDSIPTRSSATTRTSTASASAHRRRCPFCSVESLMLEGRVALITGAASGQGRAAACCSRRTEHRSRSST